jgi:cell division protein FtsW
MLRRTDNNPLARWWWTVDRVLLAAVLALCFVGLVLSFAASPPVAERLKIDSFHFVIRHALFLIPALVVLIVTSLLSQRALRRAALGVFLIMLALTGLTLVIGEEVKGATRWIDLGGFSLQPSEFLKPAFVVVVAWLFAEGLRRPEMPGTLLAVLLLAPVAGLLVLQPDFGQTLLVGATWGAIFFMAGLSWVWIAVLGGLAAAGVVVAYQTVPHVAGRIDRFLDPASGDTYQTDRAIESFLAGGWFGRGPGEGSVKYVLPDSHTDFVFAVAGEEFGAAFCLLLVALYGYIVLRGIARAYQEDDAFVRLALSGLVILIGLQATINMAVNLHLMPAKGMTLPFISYGGSSLISLAFAMGMVLALSRRNPHAMALKAASPSRLLTEEAFE